MDGTTAFHARFFISLSEIFLIDTSIRIVSSASYSSLFVVRLTDRFLSADDVLLSESFVSDFFVVVSSFDADFLVVASSFFFVVSSFFVVVSFVVVSFVVVSFVVACAVFPLYFTLYKVILP